MDTVAELNPADELRQAVSTVEFAPLLLRRHHQSERHGEAGLAAEAALGALRSMSHGDFVDGVDAPSRRHRNVPM